MEVVFLLHVFKLFSRHCCRDYELFCITVSAKCLECRWRECFCSRDGRRQTPTETKTVRRSESGENWTESSHRGAAADRQTVFSLRHCFNDRQQTRSAGQTNRWDKPQQASAISQTHAQTHTLNLELCWGFQTGAELLPGQGWGENVSKSNLTHLFYSNMTEIFRVFVIFPRLLLLVSQHFHTHFLCKCFTSNFVAVLVFFYLHHVSLKNQIWMCLLSTYDYNLQVEGGGGRETHFPNGEFTLSCFIIEKCLTVTSANQVVNLW